MFGFIFFSEEAGQLQCKQSLRNKTARDQPEPTAVYKDFNMQQAGIY